MEKRGCILELSGYPHLHSLLLTSTHKRVCLQHLQRNHPHPPSPPRISWLKSFQSHDALISIPWCLRFRFHLLLLFVSFHATGCYCNAYLYVTVAILGCKPHKVRTWLHTRNSQHLAQCAVGQFSESTVTGNRLLKENSKFMNKRTYLAMSVIRCEHHQDKTDWSQLA